MIIRTRVLSSYVWREKDDWGFWIRLFGYGFSISNSPPLFSERAGLRKAVRIIPL